MDDAGGAVDKASRDRPRERHPPTTETIMDFEQFRQTCQQFLRTSSQFLGLAAALPLPPRPASQPAQPAQQAA
ncbi:MULTISPECIES: hypothetical protein [unclassified Cupriavidus]|nr:MULTISPECIES: hypothetical protein [unclassified Cupriavidus]MBP0630083.1 hypothetical protein [Cupriavidus sp. AcVe19-1a]MBP0634791.1 hypothetical protein [Cupriavidus sp. AcVe19-6a]